MLVISYERNHSGNHCGYCAVIISLLPTIVVFRKDIALILSGLVQFKWSDAKENFDRSVLAFKYLDEIGRVVKIK